jgi:hypothetical protein
MKYRIKQRHNFITGEIKYAVEQQIYEGDKGWMLSQYTDENEERKFAIFDTLPDAKLFVCNGKVVGEEIVWEGEA